MVHIVKGVELLDLNNATGAPNKKDSRMPIIETLFY